MWSKDDMISVESYGWHKGFYNDENFSNSLRHIRYDDFFEYPDNPDFPYNSAYELLRGSCHHFALSLNKMLGYSAYIIEGNNKRGFHAFCQIYRNNQCFYVDARGITSSFDEFMLVASEFVNDEYTIRAIEDHDIEEWKNDSNYHAEALVFAEAVIEKFKECYILPSKIPNKIV